MSNSVARNRRVKASLRNRQAGITTPDTTRMSLSEKLEALRAVGYAIQAAEAESRKREWERTKLAMDARRARILACTRQAMPVDYSMWVTGYMRQGGEPSKFYDHPMPTGEWRVALTDFAVEPLLGNDHVLNVIFPPGLSDLGGDTGHSKLYLTRGKGDDLDYLIRGFHDANPVRPGPYDVPVFSDTVVLD